jgi:cysteinyl-tRNA synthetase
MGLLSTEFGGSGASPELMIKAYEIYQSYRPKIHNRLPNARSEFESKIAELGGEVKYLDDGSVYLVQVKTETSKIDELIALRNAARKAKNFQEADRIRDELIKMGIALKDSRDPVTGEPITMWEPS